MQALANLWIALISLAVMISLVLSIFQGSLVSTWMLVNTLQLIAHLPLIATKLPANAHYFLLNLLSVVRLSFEQFNAAIDDLDSQIKEYELLSDKDNFFSANLRDSGYHISFTRNMMFFISLMLLTALVWMITAVIERICRRSRAHQEDSESTQRSASKEVFMNNFMVRFLYEAFFELCLCALINISASTSRGPGGTGTWLMSLLILVACLTAIIAVISLYFKNGPYVPGTYEKGTFLSSFWGARPLSEQI